MINPSDATVLLTWVRERAERNSAYLTPASELYDSWHSWAIRNYGEAASRKAFGKALRDHGFTVLRKSVGTVFVGIRLRPTSKPATIKKPRATRPPTESEIDRDILSGKKATYFDDVDGRLVPRFD